MLDQDIHSSHHRRTKNVYSLGTGLQIYGGPGSLSHDFKIWPLLSNEVGPVDPSFLVVKKNLTLMKIFILQ